MGLICYTIARAMGGAKDSTPADFMPRWRGETDAELLAKAQAIFGKGD